MGPLAEILQLESRVGAAAAESGESEANTVAFQLREHNELLGWIEKRGTLGRWFVDVYASLIALRSLRESGVEITPPDPSYFQLLHRQLLGIPGMPPAPTPDTLTNVEDEIAHLEAVLKVLDHALLPGQKTVEPTAPPDIDGLMTLANFAQLCGRGCSKSTLEKRVGKPAPAKKGKGRAPSLYSYRELREWLPKTGLTPQFPLPESFAEAKAMLGKILLAIESTKRQKRPPSNAT
ncbi:MAG TPA: hypothetical protein VMP01_10305 [Pirellulaceae bacterium]|nr:hypothetical protein [Pirellulaceae bacterium]